MKDTNKTIGDMIDKASTTIISSVDENGFPNTKAMLPPRKRNGIKNSRKSDRVTGYGN